MDASTVRSSALTPPRSAAAAVSVPEVNPQFFKTAVQDLNNPITTIKTALTLLNSSALKPQQRQRYLQMIGQACDRQSQLINHVFALLELQLTPQTTALEKVQLWDLVPGVVSTYQPLAQENNILLAYTVAAHLPPVLAIEGYLKQVLVSLLSNSIQFTNGNGRIWVNAHQRADKKVALVIQDNGCGIMPSALPQVFNSFYRSTSDSSSLGLTLVEQLLAHCNASISVSRSPGKGVTFTILLSTEPD
ncbi:HAMP domain-containing histidine kinase [Leptolyngbya cf. ectocarpi LEGE 11479]|uniref:histidine kinase n=1 Tax=Leptolyngbya cf. ectocarpi LEGE 11479 TaxID=1828722 RepID=A0A928ZTI7_LEPEC|nr:HAMP domain-containing sensor histidine kinase [Leptolyngbya ectocarpi]MBE9065684.1 HAMP domain-containing histidine kinase [Leptolyngbya cf. ectocarpi LEGE 11479]